MPQNLFKITAEECKKSFPVDVRRSTTSQLKVVLKVMTENGIYSLPMKVILTSLVCLFFARRPHQNCARVSHAMAQSFQTTLLLVKRSAAFSYPDYSKLNSNWNTYTNPPPDQYRPVLARAKPYRLGVSRQLSRPRGVLIRDISRSTATNPSPQTIAPGIGSMLRACTHIPHALVSLL